MIKPKKQTSVHKTAKPKMAQHPPSDHKEIIKAIALPQDHKLAQIRKNIASALKCFTQLPHNYYYAKFCEDKESQYMRIFYSKQKGKLTIRTYKYCDFVNHVVHQHFLFVLFKTMLRLDLRNYCYDAVDLGKKDIRQYAGLCSDNKRSLYYLCGYQDKQASKTCQRYSVEENTWACMPDSIIGGRITTCCYLYPKVYMCVLNESNKQIYTYALNVERTNQFWANIPLSLNSEFYVAFPFPSDIVIFYQEPSAKDKQICFYNNRSGKSGIIPKPQLMAWNKRVTHYNNGMNIYGLNADKEIYYDLYILTGKQYSHQHVEAWENIFGKQ